MPGYAIHLAVGREFYKKNPNAIKSFNEFENGIIAPDYKKDLMGDEFGREKTHSITLEKRVDELSDFEKGYIVHLFTDKLFYQVFEWDTCIYEDYDRTNEYVCEKYNVVLPEEELIKNQVKFAKGKSKVFSIKQLDLFIEESSNFSLKQMVEYLQDEKGTEKIKKVIKSIEKQ